MKSGCYLGLREELEVEGDALVAVEASMLGGYAPARIVARAWNFRAINEGYRTCMDALTRMRKGNRRVHLREAIMGWNRAAEPDPFLPSEIELRGYLGRKAWEARIKFLSEAV